MAARGADLLERGVLDAHAGPAVDQQQLPLQRRKPRRLFGQHGVEHRPDAELLGALALQRHFRDAALDDLKTNPAVLDVLRRNDRAAEVKAGGAIDVADGSRDRGEVGLRHLFADVGLIGRNQPVGRYRDGAGDGDAAAARTSGLVFPAPPFARIAASAIGAAAGDSDRIAESSKRLSVCLGS